MNINSRIDQKLQVYIPLIMEEYINEEYIINVFNKLNIGKVSYVDFYNREGGGRIALICMNSWHNNITVLHLQERIINQEETARIVYDDPNYWVIMKCDECIRRFYIETQMVQIIQDNNILIAKNNHKIMDNNHKIMDNNNIYNELKTLKYALINNSCCGAVSNAWLPSYPSN